MHNVIVISRQRLLQEEGHDAGQRLFWPPWALPEASVFPAADSRPPQDSLADLVLQLQLARREKRGLELREAALRAQGPAHLLLLQQLGWERAQLAGDLSSSGSSSQEEDREEEEQHYQVRLLPSWSPGASPILPKEFVVMKVVHTSCTGVQEGLEQWFSR